MHNKEIYQVDEEQRNRVVYQLLYKSNWNIVSDVEQFFRVFDRMPQQMRLIVDLKLTGHSNREIAETIQKDINVVEVQLNRAKKRLIRTFL